ncbi:MULTISPECIES: hypothetical protein [unclassified Rhizobium]|uniref:hypothetical protein n=1 Tax=unclassified Rhizobium TaxID=2613769 RepID=UPI000A6DBED9|nr:MULTISPECIES: hypothetical protein [unclassified Rhizobium]
MTGDGGPARLPPLPSRRTTRQRPRPAATAQEHAGQGARSRARWLGAKRHLPLAPLWGLAMALCAVTSLLLQGRIDTGHSLAILVLFFFGGSLAFPVAVFAAQALGFGRRAETRFAGSFLCLTLLTIGITGILFALQYRLFFAQWHAPFATRIWFYQFAFTGAGAIYQFIVMGIRLYLPLGLPALLGMSLWLTRVQR